MSDVKKKGRLSEIFAAAAFFSIFGGFSTVIYQVFLWLKDGLWKSMSILYPFYDSWHWARYPYDWVWVHKILEFIPMSFGLVVLGIVLIIAGVSLKD